MGTDGASRETGSNAVPSPGTSARRGSCNGALAALRAYGPAALVVWGEAGAAIQKT